MHVGGIHYRGRYVLWVIGDMAGKDISWASPRYHLFTKIPVVTTTPLLWQRQQFD